MKKALSLCLVMLLFLTACASGGTGTAASAATAAATAASTAAPAQSTSAAASAPDASKYEVTEPITIEFWDSYSEPEKSGWMQAAAERFSASQDLITVEYKSIAGYTAMDEQLTAAQAAGGGLPALAFINCPRELTYAAGGMTEPLDDYIAASGFDIGDFNEGMVDAMKLESDGRMYGMPIGISSACVYWNMDILKKAGISEPPETWDEMRKAAHIIKDKTGESTFGTLSELNYIEVLMRNAGADPLGDGTVSDLRNEDIVSWMKEYKEMIDAGEADLFIGANQGDDLVTAFYAGKLACMVNTIAIVNQVDDNSDFEVVTRFALKDKLDPPISCVAGAAAVIPAANDQSTRNAAWQFLSFLLSKENVADWSYVSATYPVRTSVYTDAGLMQKLYDEQPLYRDIYAGMNGVVSKNKTPRQTAAYKILLDAMGQYFYNGADFDTVWTAAESEINDVLADQ